MSEWLDPVESTRDLIAALEKDRGACEAEIVALSETSKEGVYLSRYLEELGFGAKSPLQIATDNSGARDLSYNPEHHDRVKHVERRHFHIRELVEQKMVVVPFVSTHDNIADFFTKPLASKICSV